ncbi:MAG: flagellar biosynthetic protein FliR [Rhodobacteraceae bacterium]|nr:flagellar biosynthetic protein FliR [Paracoccaceae bacterium]
MDLSVLVTAQITGAVVVFARIGSILMFMPGFGETRIPMRFRLIFALVLCLALYPATPVGPLQFDSWLAFAPLVAIEVTIGLWIGLTARIIMSALQLAGYQIGFASGLANAFAPNMDMFQGATIVASALLMFELVLIFATDLHHVIIRALLASYTIFPTGQVMLGDLAGHIVKAVDKSFYIGLSLAAPFYVMGMVMNAGLGLANRMMPSLPVFFVAGPIFTGAGLYILAVSGPSIVRGFQQSFAEWLATLTF